MKLFKVDLNEGTSFSNIDFFNIMDSLGLQDGTHIKVITLEVESVSTPAGIILQISFPNASNIYRIQLANFRTKFVFQHNIFFIDGELIPFPNLNLMENFSIKVLAETSVLPYNVYLWCTSDSKPKEEANDRLIKYL